VSLRARFAAAASLAVAIVTVILAVAVYASTRSEQRGQVDEALNERVRVYQDTDGFRSPGRPTRPSSGSDGGYRGPTGLNGTPPQLPFGGASGSFQSVSPTGKVSRPSGEAALPVDARTKAIAAKGAGRYFRDAYGDVKGSDGVTRRVHLRILTVGSGTGGAVQVARPLTEVDSSLHRLWISLTLMGVGGILLAALLGVVVARTALAPVRRFTARTETIIDDPDLSHRLEVRGDDELARLAASFNASLTALEQSVESQRQLVADASHELRTPISSLRANVQILDQIDRLPPEERDALRADIIAELDELTAIVADVVELARGSRPAAEVDDTRVDLVVRALVDRFERRADAPTFVVDLEETVARVDSERIARAISNLLSNAVKWSPPGGRVDVVLRSRTLTVRDSGPGFLEEDLPHVFERFYRAASARSKPGSGLGLAIVRQAVETAGGTVSAENAPGGGALVRVALPAT
jgi:two-component system, OmpR family, sensor histidine kinase MprB